MLNQATMTSKNHPYFIFEHTVLCWTCLCEKSGCNCVSSPDFSLLECYFLFCGISQLGWAHKDGLTVQITSLVACQCHLWPFQPGPIMVHPPARERRNRRAWVTLTQGIKSHTANAKFNYTRDNLLDICPPFRHTSIHMSTYRCRQDATFNWRGLIQLWKSQFSQV